MDELILQTSNLVYLAMLFAFAGFALTNQILLRTLVLGSSAIYIAYYYVHTDEPQWSAIISSAVVASANVYGLIQLLLSRSILLLTREERALYAHMPVMEPGQFRTLLRAGTLERLEAPRVLTRAGEPLSALHFIFEGRARVRKENFSFIMAPGGFVGEVAYMLDSPASADCEAPQGALILSWDRAALMKKLKKKPALKQALEARIARDMAGKVASGVNAEFADP